MLEEMGIYSHYIHHWSIQKLLTPPNLHSIPNCILNIGRFYFLWLMQCRISFIILYLSTINKHWKLWIYITDMFEILRFITKYFVVYNISNLKQYSRSYRNKLKQKMGIAHLHVPCFSRLWFIFILCTSIHVITCVAISPIHQHLWY